MEDGQRFFFVHVMKTGGGTLRSQLRANFRPRECWPSAALDRDPPLRVSSLVDLSPERRREIRAYMGHLPYCAIAMAGIEATTLTMLREPVARTISFLRWRQLRDPRPLDELYGDDLLFRGMIHNHQTKVFALAPEDEPNSVLRTLREPRLELAKENLARVDAVGLQERPAEFRDELTSRFGLAFDAVEDRHVSEPGSLPEGLAERIAADNAADVELYDWAAANLVRR